MVRLILGLYGGEPVPDAEVQSELSNYAANAATLHKATITGGFQAADQLIWCACIGSGQAGPADQLLAAAAFPSHPCPPPLPYQLKKRASLFFQKE